MVIYYINHKFLILCDDKGNMLAVPTKGFSVYFVVAAFQLFVKLLCFPE